MKPIATIALVALIAGMALGPSFVLGQSTGINVFFSFNQTGTIYPGSPSQVIPGSFITFNPPPGSISTASYSAPVVLVVNLPDGATLGQTLATGGRGTSSPLPSAGEKVIDLAVSTYSAATNSPSGTAALAGIGPHAVQLLRYVAGEQAIWIRVNEPTTNWIAPSQNMYLGFTIGVGGGVLPANGASNWGTAGLRTQEATLLYMDLRQFNWVINESAFPLVFSAFEQHTNRTLDIPFFPPGMNSFHLTGLQSGTPPAVSAIGTILTNFTVADLDLDGREDVISVDQAHNLLVWAKGNPDNSFGEPDWRDLTGIATAPATVNVADVTGDNRPDILIGDRSGQLIVLDWNQLFAPIALATKVAAPTVALALAGAPSASMVADINGDGLSDYIFTDGGTNQLKIDYGADFNRSEAYAAGTSPVALCIGDFNGDHTPDIAVANSGSNSLTVYWNSGSGFFTQTDLAGVGKTPVGIDTGDFNRDSRMDLAVALQADEAVAVLQAQPDGRFDVSKAQKIYFLNKPSALQVENFDGLNGADVLLGFSDYYKLALCTSDAAGKLSVAYNLNTLGDVVVDPFNNVILSENNIISVASGTSLGGVSSRDGVAGIAAQPFDVIHFPRSRDISFAIVNPDTANALLNLELYDDSGALIAADTETVPGGGQFARFFPSLFGDSAKADGRWVRGFVSGRNVYGIWLAGNGSASGDLDGSRIQDVRDAASAFIFPELRAGPGSFTDLTLINPSRSQAHLSLHLLNAFGVEKAVHSRLLDGRARAMLPAASIFPALSEDDYIQVTSDVPLLGNEMFGDFARFGSLDGQQPPPAGMLVCPHVAVGDFGNVIFQSMVTLINTSDTLARMTAYLYSDNGSLLGTYRGVNVGAHFRRSFDLKQIFNLTQPASGYLVIDPAGATGIQGYITFGDAAGERIDACLPLQTVSHSGYILGHLASGTIGGVTYYTGVSILNTDNDFKFAVVEAYNQDGVKLASRQITLQANQRMVFLLDQFMPGLGPVFGGYMIIRQEDTKSGYYVFELFGDTGFNLLSAVPAQPLG